MRTKFLAAFIALLAVGAQAAPISFSSASYDTTAFAVSGTLADANSDASPSPPPLVSAATVIVANDFATSYAIAAAGLLSASAEADSFAGAVGANSGAQAHFLGSFTGTGPLALHFGFGNSNSLVGAGAANATLFVLLTNVVGSTTTTLYNNSFTTAGDIYLSFNILAGVTSLDLVLYSEASTISAGQSGQNYSQVAFDGTIAVVPEPSTYAFLMIGLVGMSFVIRRRA